VLGMLGDAYCALGDYQLAADSLERALPLFHAHHAGRYYPLCQSELGYVRMKMGELEIARCREAIGRQDVVTTDHASRRRAT
jgi:hypothetical protein